MSRNVARTPRAQAEIEAIADLLEGQRENLGFRFLEAVQNTLGLVASMPGIGVSHDTTLPRLRGLRCVIVARFPNHLVFYRRIEGGIEVVRVLHGARDIPSLLEDTE